MKESLKFVSRVVLCIFKEIYIVVTKKKDCFPSIKLRKVSLNSFRSIEPTSTKILVIYVINTITF